MKENMFVCLETPKNVILSDVNGAFSVKLKIVMQKMIIPNNHESYRNALWCSFLLHCVPLIETLHFFSGLPSIKIEWMIYSFFKEENITNLTLERLNWNARNPSLNHSLND